MRPRSLVLVVVMLVLGGRAEAGRGDLPAPLVERQSSDWTAVRTLAPGSQIRIQQEDGRSTQGIVRSVADDQISVSIDQNAVSLARPSIRRIELASGRQTRKGALIGLLIGAAGGALQGVLTTKSSRGVWTASFAAGWGGIGALFGALDGSRRPKYVRVYQGLVGAPE